jgi:hypothetical protein
VSVEFMRRVRKLGRYREAVDTVDRAVGSATLER